jgi:Flp pilus assembly protein TadD
MKQGWKSCLDGSAWASVAVLLLFASAPGLKAQSKRQGLSHAVAPNGKKVTFNRDIAPILFKYCAVCHSPGESAPFSLLTCQDARRHARQMVAVTRSRFMPPWLPAPGYGDFVGERRLTHQQIALFKQWVHDGELQGDPKDLPFAPHFVPGWQLGEPDLVVRMTKPYTLRATGWDVYRNFILPVRVKSPHYVEAIEINPGNTRIIHHCNLLVDPLRSLRRLDGRDGLPGFPGMDLTVGSDVFDPAGNFLFWKPGAPPYVEPEGLSWQLNPGSDLILNVHMQPTGKPETLQASVGLYFTDQPPTQHPILLQLEDDGALDIPPGDKHFVITDQFTLPLDVKAYGVYPHAHYLGKDLEGYATLPDGTRKWLIWIKSWDQNWQGVYRYVNPVFLPKGTVLHMRYTYDNSEDNPFNPNHPPKRVLAGNRASDEMGHLWIQVAPAEPKAAGIDSRMVLQEAMMLHWLEKYPGDYVAHFNLGAVLQAEGKLDDAITQYRAALQAKPRSATAETSLGTALEAEGKLNEAIPHFRRAIQLDPSYSDPHYDLGVCLLAGGDGDGAVNEFEQVLRLKPEDAMARRHLADALRARAGREYSMGDLSGAVRDLRKVLEIDPKDIDSCNNLGTALARQGHLAEAKVLFQRALEVDPHNAAARRNLAIAQSLMRQKGLE